MSATRSAAALAVRLSERERVVERFFDAEAERLARACHAIARQFSRGGTLIPFGTNAAVTDAAHATVEFMHPVIVGKRALPALAPPADSGSAATRSLTRPDDIALGLAHDRDDEAACEFLERARQTGMLTIALLGPANGGADPQVDYLFRVGSDDPCIVQEVQETAYHVLWELVHVFFEHPGLLEDACITCGDAAVEAVVVAVAAESATIERGGAREEVATDLVGAVAVGERLLCHAGVALERFDASASAPPAEPGARNGGADDPSGFLYPFLGREEVDVGAVLADVRDSTIRKAADVTELRGAIDLAAIERCADAVRKRLVRGGRLVSFGNGGSSTDAQDVALDAAHRGWAALALNDDVATITAVGNDVGFDKVFARQLIPLGRPHDVALAITTSGNSVNVLAGLEEARDRHLLTCAIAGYDGGRLAGLQWLDHLFVVRSDYIPRIQEAQATIYHLLLEAVGSR